MILFFFTLIFLTPPSFAIESSVSDIELPAITKEGVTEEDLSEELLLTPDPIIRAQRGQLNLNSGTGFIQNSIQNQLATPFSDSGLPGNRTQMRGLGLSPEDVDVQIFGISLNPPQGGGFDFSTFPQYLWADFQFQSGPALHSIDPSATAGTLALVPWTLRALSHSPTSGWKIQGRGYSSSQGVQQIAASAREGGTLAIIAGYSRLKVTGPSMGFSSRWNWQSEKNRGNQENYTGSFHLLASDLDAESPGSVLFPTPLARMRSQRALGVFQNDFQFSSESSLRFSIFSDFLALDYNDPGSYQSKDSPKQWGAETTYRLGDWKWSLGARQIKMVSSHLLDEVPVQSIGNVQISRGISWTNTLLEPMIQAVWATSYGVLPGGSLGLRQEWEQGKRALFARVTFSRRIPSLLDRYYVFPGFVGNPHLKTERNWTGVVGGEVRSKAFDISVQAYAQVREDARVVQGASVTNLNDARIQALTGKAVAYLSDSLDWSHSVTFSRSTVSATGFDFPYVSPWMGNSGFSLHSEKPHRSWEGVINLRFEGSRVFDVSTGDRLPAYGVIDLGFSFELTSQIFLSSRCENLLDRPIELIQGFPLGRTFSMMISGEL